MPIKLSIYEALTEAGVKPDKARAVERELEGALQSSHDAIRAEWHEQLMTKADGASLRSELNAMRSELKADMASLETRLNARLNDQLRWIITTQVAVVGLAIAAIKLL
ncbi:hypothetical protein [Xylophilus sp. ASV27]|uniref:hypothetical protein n=1 Tax=Xylophilus sp. ASV27 TaxID=2795129 RepID=UPI0018EA6048|nr:hypothetical protein [Xylophilus sp. ASV27]